MSDRVYRVLLGLFWGCAIAVFSMCVFGNLLSMSFDDLTGDISGIVLLILIWGVPTVIGAASGFSSDDWEDELWKVFVFPLISLVVNLIAFIVIVIVGIFSDASWILLPFLIALCGTPAGVILIFLK